jgi:hypothetical protein
LEKTAKVEKIKKNEKMSKLTKYGKKRFLGNFLPLFYAGSSPALLQKVAHLQPWEKSG